MGGILSEVGTINNILRTILSMLDMAAYGLLKYTYLLFFNVASSEVLSGEVVARLFARIQLIIGVFMMFQLAMTIIKGIMNPDSFTDSKTGAGNLITRIVTALVLLTLLVPVNIPSPKNQYEKQINNNGILFGTLYSLQYRILSQNTLGRLILGTDVENYTAATTTDDEYENMVKASNRFSSTIVRVFYKFATFEEDADPAVLENRVCQSMDDDVYDTYTDPDADPVDIISMVNEKCDADTNFIEGAIQSVPGVGWVYKKGKHILTGATVEYYVFSITPFISAIVGFVFVYLLIKMTFEVAVRAVKLAVLRLIAPIPIISYMDPKGGKDSAFSSWLKLLVSTYLDLFIKLAVIYLVMSVVMGMIDNGVALQHGEGFLGGLTWCIIWIGLFIFAKDADKFLKQALGLKDNGGKFFSAFGQALGFGAAGVGAIGSVAAGYRSSKLADETREAFGDVPEGTSTRLRNRGKHVIAGIAGGIMGGYTGASASLGAKDHNARAAWDAIQKRNAATLSRGNDGSTLLGRMRSTVSQALTGEGLSGEGERKIASMESRKKAMEAISSRVSGEMVKKNWTKGKAEDGWHDASTGALLDGVLFNHKRFEADLEAAMASGATTMTAHAADGSTYTISTNDAKIMKGQIQLSNEDDYFRRAKVAGTDEYDSVLAAYIEDAKAKGGSAYNSTTGTSDVKNHNTIDSRKSYKQTIDALDAEILKTKRSNTINKSNDQHSNDKK